MGFRLAHDDGYYKDRPVPHVAQGDLYDGVPCAYVTALADPDKERGARKRPLGMFWGGGDTPPAAAPICRPESALVVVCNYTCGFVAQPPGQTGYSHMHRLVAPVVPLWAAIKNGVSRGEARRIRDNGYLSGLPLCVRLR